VPNYLLAYFDQFIAFCGELSLLSYWVYITAHV